MKLTRKEFEEAVVLALKRSLKFFKKKMEEALGEYKDIPNTETQNLKRLNNLMIVDTHSQLWTREALRTLPPAMLRSYENIFKGIRAFELEDILADMDEAGIDMSVIVAVDAETVSHYKIPNELVAQAVKRYPKRFIGFAGVDPHKGGLAVDEVVRSAEELGLAGLKFT